MTRQDALREVFWPSLLITLILGSIALFSVAAQQAWLAPSLASAVFSQLLHPDDSGSRPTNIAGGQMIGLGAGFIGVWIAGAIHSPPLMGHHDLPAARVLAVAFAVLFASITQALTGFKTPAGGATALVAALGIETVTWIGAVRMLVGIALVTALGEIARRFLINRRSTRTPIER